MFKRTIHKEDLDHLKRERDEADRLYNDALSSLDRARIRPPELPSPPPPPDDHVITPLNESWRLVADGGPGDTGWRGRLAGLVWRLIGPYVQRQQHFNALVVEHVNRTHAGAVASRQSAVGSLTVLDRHMEALAAFQLHLLHYAQQLARYVDSKDYEAAALARRINEDVAETAEELDQRARALIAAVKAFYDALHRRMESVEVGTQRMAEQVDEVRSSFGLLQHEIRSIGDRLAADASDPPRASRAADAPGEPPGGPAPSSSAGATLAASVTAYAYVGFEDRFRGSQEEIRARLVDYVPLFQDASNVLDLGCGRGEFLDLLRESAISARGLDLNPEMVAACRARDLDADVGDALAFLEAQEDDSLGGLFSSQVVEHLEPTYLVRLLTVAARKLRPGSRIVLDTINPSCWFAFFDAYIRDITHVRPLHPDTLKYLLTASGFQRTSVLYRAPFPDELKLQSVTLPSPDDPPDDDPLAATVDVLNRNVKRLNDLLFTHLDYAAIGERL